MENLLKYLDEKVEEKRLLNEASEIELSKEVFELYSSVFENLSDAGQTFNRFVKFYNYKRIHSGIEYLSPYKYLLSKGTEIKAETSTLDVLSLVRNKVA